MTIFQDFAKRAQSSDLANNNRRRTAFIENCRFRNFGPVTIPAAAAAPFEFKPLTLHCMTLGCDFEYESSPTIAQPLGCPKCGGHSFSTTILSGQTISVTRGTRTMASGYLRYLDQQDAGVEELELSPVQAECWAAIEERQARLAQRQPRWLRFKLWLGRNLDDQPDFLFVSFVVAASVACGVFIVLMVQSFTGGFR